MSSSKKHCKNLFYNFPCDLPLSPWIFRKISGYHDKHRDQFYSERTKISSWTFTLVWHKILAAPVGVLHSTDTHLTTDVIYSHMHKDGSLFYAFQVHVSVTWNRGSRAGTGWDRAQEEQMEISLCEQHKKSSRFLPAPPHSEDPGCWSITLPHSGTWATPLANFSPIFCHDFIKQPCPVSSRVYYFCCQSMIQTWPHSLDFQSIIKTANLSSKVSLLRLDALVFYPKHKLFSLLWKERKNTYTRIFNVNDWTGKRKRKLGENGS